MPFHSGYGYYGTGDWLWSLFSTALFIVLVTMAIVLLVRLFSGARRQGPGGTASRPVGGPWFGSGPGDGPGVARSRWAAPEAEGAERILAERYARGEISEEEYRSRLEVLRQAGQVGGWAQQPARPATQPQSATQSQPHVPRQESAEQPPVPSAAWQQSAEPPAAASAAHEHEQRTEEVT